MFFLCRLMECKSFFYANYFNWSLTSPVIANHAIWQKSWSTSIVLTVFPWILEVNASKEEKRACPFSSSTPRQKKTTKSFCRQRVSFEISRERQELLLQSRKMAKRWQSSWKTHWNYHGIEFHEFVSERSELFWPRSSQARDEVTRGPVPYKNRMKYCFESLL